MSEGFLWAVKNGDLDQVKALFEAEKPDVNATIAGGRAPLHYAADMGQDTVAEFLVSKGAEVNQKDVHGITPLLAAIWEGHTKTVQFLLSKGARKDLKAPDGTAYINCAEKAEIKVRSSYKLHTMLMNTQALLK